MTDDIIFHLVTASDWKSNQDAGLYKPESLAEEGFIHCSTGQQVQEIANAQFRGESDLLLIVIDVASLESDLKMEQADDRDEIFPHIKGPLNIDAVIDKIKLEPEEDGSFFIRFDARE
ncbi:MAG: DUF952 domain-containing protein [Balneolaceae bacterium]|nr:DUF952 domain-containing protein [Balneolaceae bacterium]